MKYFFCILFLLFFNVKEIIAQDFVLEYPRRADDFTYSFLTVLNDAPIKFVHYRGKPTNKKDSIHKGSTIFDVKIKLPGSTKSRLVVDSTTYAEYFYGDFEAIEDATIAYDYLKAKVNKALSKRIFVKDFPLDTSALVVKQTKIAYCGNRGFYHFNITTQIIRLQHNNQFRVLLQLYSGKPQFYYRIMRNEPIASFVLINQLKNNLANLQSTNTRGCPTDIANFYCLGKKVIKDSIIITYQKNGFEDYPNAKTEFDALLTNVRVSLGSEYVYYNIPVKLPSFKSLAYININDLDNKKRSIILLEFLEITPQNTPLKLPKEISDSYSNVKQVSLKKEYAIQMSFIH